MSASGMTLLNWRKLGFKDVEDVYRLHKDPKFIAHLAAETLAVSITWNGEVLFPFPLPQPS